MKGAGPAEGLAVEVEGVEVRVRSLYAGALDSSLLLQGSLQRPLLGGSIQVSPSACRDSPPCQSVCLAVSD